MLQINMTAVIVAVVANFILGFLWYTPLFGKVWAKELGFDMSGPKPPASVMIKGMTFMIIGNFLMAYVFAHNIAAWGFVTDPNVQSMSKTGNLMNSAIFTWLGFYVPGDLSRVAWEKASWKLFFINTGYHLATLFVAAGILIYM